jgi:SH3-like domain-containing protein
MSRLFILIIVTISSLSCSENKIPVQDVTLEEVAIDSSESKGPPTPTPQSTLTCNCDVLIDTEYKGDIELYDKPNGTVIKIMKHNFKDEDLLIATLEQDSSDYFLAHVRYAISGNDSRGWLKKSEHIGVYGRNYDTSLILYASPGETSKVNATISWDPQLYKVERCSGKWLLVSLRFGNKKKKGWLSPEMQCANPYSTCN